MLKNTLKWIIPLTMAGFNPVANASFYLNIGAGGVISNSHSQFTANSTSVLYAPTAIGTSLFTLPNVNWHTRFNNGFNLNAAFGYQFNTNWRSDVEVLYQNIERESYGRYGWREQYTDTGAIYSANYNNLMSHVSNRANLSSFLTNVAYDFKNRSKWTPLIGGGIGVAWLSSNSLQTHNILDIDDPVTPLHETASALQTSPSLYGTAFAWQAKLGLAYEMTQQRSMSLQYRVFGTTKFQASNSYIITNPGVAGQSRFNIGQYDLANLLTQAIELNLRFNL